MNKKLQLFAFIIIIIISYCTKTIDDCVEDFELLKESECQSLNGEKSGEQCYLINNECVSKKPPTTPVYSDCKDYKDGKKEVCEALTQILTDPNYKCVLEGSECKKVLHECSDFLESSECTTITDTEENQKICYFVKGKCEEHFKTCEEIKDKSICDSNILPTEKKTKRCKWSNSKCDEIDRTCEDDYIQGLTPECTTYTLTDENKQCIYNKLTGKCIENYKTCASGNGESKKCNAILYIDSSGEVDYTQKCDLNEENQCVNVAKTCNEYNEYKNEYLKISIDCNSFSIVGKDNNKQCLLIDGICTEDYPDCTSYKGKDSATCKKIKASTVGEKCDIVEEQCKSIPKTCSDFKLDSLKAFCTRKNPYFTNKCSYSNGNCKEEKKTCKDLASSSEVTQLACEGAITSDSTKKCEIKPDKSGCQEVDIPQDNTKASSKSSNSKDENTNGADKINSIIVFTFICLLLL